MADETKLQISKIEAARRQLDTAIEMWFCDKDPVSVHTVAAAAYQIVHDVKVRRGIDHGLLYDSKMVKDEYRGQWINAMKKAQNFFKHADRDPEGILEFSPFGNLVFILLAAAGLRLLKVDGSHEVGALFLWLTLHEPGMISKEYIEMFHQRTGIDDFEDVKAIPKAVFFEQYLEASRLSTRTSTPISTVL